jgi:hypothetical protein
MRPTIPNGYDQIKRLGQAMALVLGVQCLRQPPNCVDLSSPRDGRIASSSEPYAKRHTALTERSRPQTRTVGLKLHIATPREAHNGKRNDEILSDIQAGLKPKTNVALGVGVHPRRASDRIWIASAHTIEQLTIYWSLVCGCQTSLRYEAPL